MSLDNKQSRSFLRGRLVWYRSDIDNSFWDRQWQNLKSEGYYKKYREGRVGKYEKLFITHLPKRGPIIEAGCGRAQFVVALEAKGYDTVGIDLAQDTLCDVKQEFPDIKLCRGDVAGLPFLDNSCAAYVSLGVVEHRLDGPEIYIQEAFRIIQRGGCAIFTVPYVNSIRRWKAKRGLYNEGVSSLPFYQYAFSRSEFTTILRTVGFEVVTIDYFSVLKGLRDEFPRFRNGLEQIKPRLLRSAISRTLESASFLGRLTGHMLAVVVKKPL